MSSKYTTGEAVIAGVPLAAFMVAVFWIASGGVGSSTSTSDGVTCDSTHKLGYRVTKCSGQGMKSERLEFMGVTLRYSGSYYPEQAKKE